MSNLSVELDVTKINMSINVWNYNIITTIMYENFAMTDYILSNFVFKEKAFSCVIANCSTYCIMNGIFKMFDKIQFSIKCHIVNLTYVAFSIVLFYIR